MNKLLVLLVLLVFCSALFAGNSFAHGDHGVISEQKALSIVAKTVNKMTFKDLGFEVGKLDKSWKGLDKSQYSITSIEKEFFVVSAINPANAQNVYFKIAKNGEVLAAKSSLAF